MGSNSKSQTAQKESDGRQAGRMEERGEDAGVEISVREEEHGTTRFWRLGDGSTQARAADGESINRKWDEQRRAWRCWSRGWGSRAHKVLELQLQSAGESAGWGSAGLTHGR